MESPIINERFIVNGGNYSYRRLFKLIALNLHKPRPRFVLPNLLLATWWRLEKLRGLITGSTPIITKETARTSRHHYHYSGEKLKQKTGFNYTSPEETVAEACRMYKLFKSSNA